MRDSLDLAAEVALAAALHQSAKDAVNDYIWAYDKEEADSLAIFTPFEGTVSFKLGFERLFAGDQLLEQIEKEIAKLWDGAQSALKVALEVLANDRG